MESQTTANIIAISAILISILQFIFTLYYFEPKKSQIDKDKNLLKNVINGFQGFLKHNKQQLDKLKNSGTTDDFIKKTRKYRDGNTYFQIKMFNHVKYSLRYPNNKEIKNILDDIETIRKSLLKFRVQLKRSSNKIITTSDIKEFNKMENKIRVIFDKYN